VISWGVAQKINFFEIRIGCCDNIDRIIEIQSSDMEIEGDDLGNIS